MRRSARRSLLAASVVLLVAAGFGIAYPYWWGYRSTATGDALINRAVENTVTTTTPAAAPSATDPASSAPSGSVASNDTSTGGTGTSTSGCASSLDDVAAPSPGDPGLLEISAIGVKAPVLSGIGDDVLNVAAGHDPQSPWPGELGEAIVEAHDVSYFASIGSVKVGDTVTWSTPCLSAQFTVTGTAIMSPGAVLNAPKDGTGLALITCYPANALFWTNQRYVVFTSLDSESIGSQQVSTATPALASISVPAPTALTAQGLDLNSNYLPLGSLYFSGSPDASWSSSPNPLIVERAALEVFFGAQKSVAQGQRGWWSDLAPKLAYPSSFPSFGVTNVTEAVDGSTPVSVTLSSGKTSATVTVAGGVAHLTALSG